MFLLLLACAPIAGRGHLPPPPSDPDVTALIEAGIRSERAYTRLAQLCDDAGHRLAGSKGLERAVDITAAWMRADGMEVRTEPVLVRTWVRGPASLQILAPRVRALPLLALGGSVGGNLEAPVVVIRNFDELGPQVAGKIVLYNHPMLQERKAIEGYGPAVAYRGRGAIAAAKHGAVAVLVRSVTARSLYTPHTGAMHYEEGVPKIPAAAITIEDAEQIARDVGRGIEVRARLSLAAEEQPPSPSHNVIGELRGSTKPEEIVLLGAHLDSWDVGQGAHDDGAGVAEVVEALRLIRAHGTPARTVRVVLFTNEENGLDGGKSYAASHGSETHVAAIESDLGGGYPTGWEVTATEAQRAWFTVVSAPIGLPITGEGGGADISPLEGVLQIGLLPEHSRYFDVHHTEADTFDKIDKLQLQRSAGTLAALAWELAEAP
jgi:hypothetical protein